MERFLPETKTGLLYAGLIGLIMSDLVPGAGDAAYFHIHRKLRDKWARGEYTSKQYWAREALAYYTLNSAWWMLVGAAVYLTPGDYKKKLKVGLLLVGAGVAAAVISKNIQKDEREKLTEKNLAKEELFTKQHAKET